MHIRLRVIVWLSLVLNVLTSNAFAFQDTTVQLDSRSLVERPLSPSDREWIKEQESFSERLRANAQPGLKQWLQQQIKNNPLSKANHTYLDNLVAKEQRYSHNKKRGAIYFISFSIPNDGLKVMLSEAHHYSIPVTLRGLVNNDMKTTVSAVQKLVQDGVTSGIQIDPTLYRRYNITAVPSLVVNCEKGYDVIHGNLHIKDALRKIVENGECGDVARTILGVK